MKISFVLGRVIYFTIILCNFLVRLHFLRYQRSEYVTEIQEIWSDPRRLSAVEERVAYFSSHFKRLKRRLGNYHDTYLWYKIFRGPAYVIAGRKI